MAEKQYYYNEFNISFNYSKSTWKTLFSKLRPDVDCQTVESKVDNDMPSDSFKVFVKFPKLFLIGWLNYFNHYSALFIKPGRKTTSRLFLSLGTLFFDAKQ